MKCADIREMLAGYWDLQTDDRRRRLVDDHVRSCTECAEEFRLWEVSSAWIRMASKEETEGTLAPSGISSAVMKRIYETDGWRMPLSMRSYHISSRLRRLSLGFLSFFLALFLFSFYYALQDDGTSEAQESFASIVPVASASTGATSTLGVNAEIVGVPVASISNPIMFRMVTVESDPNYWVALSIIGLSAIVLIMNWLSRLKA